MKCAWQAYLNILPVWLRSIVDKRGKESLLEIRLRLNRPPELVTLNGSVWLDRFTSAEDICFCVNVASQYSPWNAKTSAFGYITAPGGHRIGLCGHVTSYADGIFDFNDLTSLCLRVARDFDGIASEAIDHSASTLVIGRPGSGKTTFLRDYIRQLSNGTKENVSVIDERSEIFPRVNNEFCFEIGKRTDVISGGSKAYGIETALRNMTPTFIALDEITANEDCEALLQAGWCGVRLVATAHAGNMHDLLKRPVYQQIIKNNIFDKVIILDSNRAWHTERMIA